MPYETVYDYESLGGNAQLEEHIKVDAGKGSRTVAVIACVISCFNVAVTIITLIAKGS